MTNLELRCSPQTRARGSDPIGTATSYDAYLLVEVPLPWPAAIGDHPLLADVMAVAGSAPGKVQVLGIVADHDDVDRHRVVAYRRPEGPFRRFVRSEAIVTTDALGTTAAALLTGPIPDHDADPPGVGETAVEADLLVCTHGRRDRCCGSFGMNLFTAIGARHVRSGVRTWRVSHTGGHRFAPTAIFLPDGHLWAWLDTELVDRILHRRGPVDDVLDHYRGSSAIGGPPVQVAEREAFRREGWGWLDSQRHGRVVDERGDRLEVRLDATRADRSVVAYRATVERVGTEPQPTCGELVTGDGNGKSDSIWSLTRFERADP